MENSNHDKIVELKKKIITLLEWDMPNIKNSELRFFKESKLKEFKKELQFLCGK